MYVLRAALEEDINTQSVDLSLREGGSPSWRHCENMTSVVDMRYTLFAPPTVSFDYGNEYFKSERDRMKVKLRNDPILGINAGILDDDEIKRLKDELYRYGVTDIHKESEMLLGDLPIFPELSLDVNDISIEGELFDTTDIESEPDSSAKFDCCCSEPCRSYDSSSEWSYPSSPRSFGTWTDDTKDTKMSFSHLLDPTYLASLDRRKEDNSAHVSQARTESNNIKSCSSPIKIEREESRDAAESMAPESMAPSPSPTEDEEEHSDCACRHVSQMNNVTNDRRNVFKESPPKRRRLNSLSSDSDQSDDCIKEPSPRKRSSKVKHRPENEEKRGNGLKPKQLYQFLMDLLRDEDYCPEYIEWVSRDEKVFRLVDSAAVARMWGECKNRENMTYEKMSRALRYYYENGILERVPNCRLHYRFGKAAYDDYASTW